MVRHTLSKTVQESDYASMAQELAYIDAARRWCDANGIFVDPAHRHRAWETGIALQAFGCANAHETALDIGAGLSIFSPALIHAFSETRVTEWEPDEQHNLKRGVYPDKRIVRKGRSVEGYFGAPHELFDGVFCLSVVEHLPSMIESWVWSYLPSLVKSGGVIVVTSDVFDGTGPVSAQDGWHPYRSPEDFWSRMSSWPDKGLIALGPPDLTYHGDEVYNYTFMSAAWKKI